MTDRGRSALRQSRDQLTVGPSSLTWTGRELVIEVNEWGAPPLVTPVRGRIILTPQAITGVEAALTPEGTHIWRPFSPSAAIRVELSQGNTWEGHGYFDANFGTRALEQDFRFWTWGRFPLANRTMCFYDATRIDGSELELAVSIDRSGEVQEITAPPSTGFRRSLWQVRRETRADAGFIPQQRLNMLDAPFYSRSLVETQLMGEKSIGVHEALDLTRFRQPVLKPMLALRVPRRPRWVFPAEA